VRAHLLPFAPPLIGDDEIAEVVATLRSDWITTGPRTMRFEQEFAVAVDAPEALAVSSCTAALHVALAALGIGPGDAVLTTTMTFCSTVHVIEQVGATPVLVDVEPDTLNLDPERVDAALAALAPGLTPKAILPVHYAGHPCEMDDLLAIAARDGLAVVEDAAHALPASFRGVPVGSVGEADGPVRRAVAFSFYATKNLTTAEGGMLTAHPDLVTEARMWSLHGMSRDAWNRYGAGGSWFYEVLRPGFKYNMTDIQAALGLHQLARLGDLHKERHRVARRYTEAFSGCDALELPTWRDHVDHAWHLYVLRLRPEVLTIHRNRFIEELAAANIATSVHFIPVHEHPYYRDRYGFSPGDLPVAHDAFDRMLSLPIYPHLADADVDDVIEAVLDVVARHRR
jgi:dTDP-4-amino-4,6-dideoxygalactose transaminase